MPSLLVFYVCTFWLSLGLVCVCARARVCVRVWAIHVCIVIHAYTCIHIHMYLGTYLQTYMHTYIHTYKHTCTHTYTGFQTPIDEEDAAARILDPVLVPVYTNTHAYLQHACMHTQIHKCVMRTHIHVYTHTCVCTMTDFLRISVSWAVV
jgi:hypothetical protein